MDYRKLAEKYLRIAEQVTDELKVNEDIIGIAVLGSTAGGNVHFLSDIDLLVLVKGSDICEWERKTVQNIVVNVALRSQDVLERMTKDHQDTIFGLKGAVILHDTQGIMKLLKKNATMTEPVQKEFLGDLLDEARSFIGKTERALAESHIESSVLCLRQGAMKLAELMFYKKKGNRINPMYFWEEIKSLSLPFDFEKLFADIHEFKILERPLLIRMLKNLRTFHEIPSTRLFKIK